MTVSMDPLAIVWEIPTAEAHWVAAEAPTEAPELEPLIRAAVNGTPGLRVKLRRDGTRWRVLAEPRSQLESEAHDATQAIVEKLRSAGVPCEPGFPADPHQPRIHVNPVE